jgi:hypothetical protein
VTSFDQQINCIQQFFTNLDKAQSGQTYEERIQAVDALRREVRTSEAAQEALRSCIWADDGAIRISAAESLSLARVYPDDSIPVLLAVLEVARERNEIEKDELWTGLAIGALTNYGPLAADVQHVVWPFLHCPPTTHVLQRMATRYAMRLAKTSSASWTLACLMCHHEDSDLRELARSIMRSEEFKNWD